MQCLQLTRGELLAATVDVALSGIFHTSYAYATIDGTTYTTEQTVTVRKGTNVTVYCGGTTYAQQYASIALNGTTVANGTNNALAEYTFSATDNCNIVFSKSKSGFYTYYHATITMPA